MITATTTMTVEVRKTRRCAPAVCRHVQQRPAAQGDADDLSDRADGGGEDHDRQQDEDQDDAEVILPLERLAGLAPTRLTWGAARDHRSRW